MQVVIGGGGTHSPARIGPVSVVAYPGVSLMAAHLPKTWNHVNDKPFTASLPDGKPVTVPESMKLPKNLHHFAVVHKMGYPSGVRCWCDASLEFALHEPGQDAKRRAFFDGHEECKPASEVKHE